MIIYYNPETLTILHIQDTPLPPELSDWIYTEGNPDQNFIFVNGTSQMLPFIKLKEINGVVEALFLKEFHVKYPLAKNTNEEFLISRIPIGSTLSVAGNDYEITETSVPIEFDHPGDYTFFLTKDGYKPLSFTIEINEAPAP